jgi:hypothetical protein
MASGKAPARASRFAALANPNPEIRNPNETRNPKPETDGTQTAASFRISGFGFLSEFGLRVSVLQVTLALSFSSAFAAVPTLDHLFPVAVQVGTTNSVTAIGKFDPWPAKVWMDAPGAVFKPETNNGKFSVEVAADAPVGPHLIRVFNEQGASALRFLIVTRDPQLAEREPNDDFWNPQSIERFPASLNGRLEKSGDVDSFAVPLEAGQTLIASVEAFTLASPVDAAVRLVDARGVQVAWNHDGRTLDPFLAWTAKSAGTYVLQVFGFAYPAESAVKFTGSDKCVYRLQLSRGPYLRYTLPLGVQRGTNTALQLAGWNCGPELPHEIHFDGGNLPAESLQTLLLLPGFDNGLTLPVGDGAELMEEEPNDIAATANHIDVPCAITGCIEKIGDEDRFSFAANKGAKFLLEVQSAALGFPVDAWLKVEDLKGKELAKNDDSDGPDAKLEWTAPEDGTIVAAVGNVLHRGGSEHFYRFNIQRAVPAVKANVSETSFTVTAGSTNELKVRIKRLHGFKQALTVSVREGLPDGLQAVPQNVPEKGEDVAIKLVASAEAKPFSGPIQIILTELDSQKDHHAVADLTSLTVNNGVPGGFNKLRIESTDQFWLTVLAAQTARDATGK